MVAKTRDVHVTEDKLILKVIDSIANESGASRSETLDLLARMGLSEIVKAASAEIPFSSDVTRSVTGEAHLRQQQITDQIRVGSIPKDQFIENMNYEQQRGSIAQRSGPAMTTEKVDIVVNDMPGSTPTPYQKALLGFKKACLFGKVNSSDVKAILEKSAEDESIKEFCKKLDDWRLEWDDKMKEITKAQERWRDCWDATLSKHAKTLGYKE